MYRTIFFDLDGTLTDSREGIVKSVRYAIEQLGGAMPPEDLLLKFIGPPLQDSFMEHCGYDAALAKRAVEVFRERYLPVGQFENRPAPGLAALCAKLKTRGFILALASSKPEALCRSICNRFGFAPFLSAVVGSPEGEDLSKADIIRKTMQQLGLEAQDASSVLMVGDRRYDVEGARACGMDCAGVDFFGYAAPGELAAAGAVTVARSAEELEQFILSRQGTRQQGAPLPSFGRAIPPDAAE